MTGISLSPRRLEVLRRIAYGQTTVDIAAALGISPKTVETHRRALMRQLGIYSVAGLTRYAIQEDVIPLWDAEAI